MKFKELVTKDNIIFTRFNLYYRSFDVGFVMEPHKHDRIEIMYACSGDFRINFADCEKQGTYDVKKGQFIVLDTDYEHHIIISERLHIINLEFILAEKSRETRYESLHNILNEVPAFFDFAKRLNIFAILSDSYTVMDDLKTIHRLLRESSRDATSELVLYLQVVNLLIDIARCAEDSRINSGSAHVNKAIKLISAGLEKQLTIAGIAACLGINPHYFQRIFKQCTGQTVVNYINLARINRAKKLLANPDNKIIDIGIAVGFNTRQNFTFAFKKLTGMSPADFRLSCKKPEYALQL